MSVRNERSYVWQANRELGYKTKLPSRDPYPGFASYLCRLGFFYPPLGVYRSEANWPLPLLQVASGSLIP